MSSQSAAQTILGLDPGTHRTGYGVVERRGSIITPLEYGVIEFAGESFGSARSRGAPERLTELSGRVTALITKHHPSAIGIETLYFSRNTTTGLAVSEARGVLLMSAGLHRIPVFEYAPTSVKQRVTGYGKSDKRAVLKMVSLILGISSFSSLDDASDALAVAIACALDTRLTT